MKETDGKKKTNQRRAFLQDSKKPCMDLVWLTRGVGLFYLRGGSFLCGGRCLHNGCLVFYTEKYIWMYMWALAFSRKRSGRRGGRPRAATVVRSNCLYQEEAECVCVWNSRCTQIYMDVHTGEVESILTLQDANRTYGDGGQIIDRDRHPYSYRFSTYRLYNIFIVWFIVRHARPYACIEGR